MRLPERVDALVIGGGINGLGIAAAAAERGLSVLLVEKGDFGGATTAASSRLIHGGLRYLQYGEFGLVRESLRERGILARRRPHLVEPIQLLIPAFRGSRPPAWQIAAGLGLYALLARDPLFPLPNALSARAAREREPGLAAEGLLGGFLYPDAQVEFPERICVELYRELCAAGGTGVNYAQVVGLLRSGDQVCGARVRHTLDGYESEVHAALTINAAGPWVDCVNALLPAPPPRLLGGVWGTHLVLPRRPDGPHSPLYVAARRDGRPVFLLPWDGRLLVGTTEVRFDGDPDQVVSEAWEVEYLLEEVNHLFPACRYDAGDIEFTTVGVRPLPAVQAPHARGRGTVGAGSRTRPGTNATAGRARGPAAVGGSPAAVTRRHFLVDHGAAHGVPGVASVVGGKLTTYRSLAEGVADWIERRLQRSGERTAQPDGGPKNRHERHPFLFGAGLTGLDNTPPRHGRDYVGVSPSPAVCSSTRLERIYGPYASEIFALIHARPDLGRPLTPNCPALVAEVVHAVRCEAARTADDVARRRLMLLPPKPEWLAEIRIWLDRLEAERGEPASGEKQAAASDRARPS